MADDAIRWEMTAFEDKESFHKVQALFTRALGDGRPIAIRDLLSLIPLSIPQANEAVRRRGMINIANGRLLNDDSDGSAFEFSFVDPAMGSVAASLASHVDARIAIASGTLTIDFSPNDLIAEIRRIAEEGFPRSTFQVIKRIEMSFAHCDTLLHDKGDDSKQLVIAVSLDASNTIRTRYLAPGRTPAAFSLLFDSSNPCFPPDSNNFFVIRRKGDATLTCQVFAGSNIVGGTNEWDFLNGPATEQACKDWIRNHPDQCQ